MACEGSETLVFTLFPTSRKHPRIRRCSSPNIDRPMKPKDSPFLALLSLTSSLALGNASAATWQWDGGALTGDWKTGLNWNPDILTTFPTGFPDVGASFAHRLNVNGATALIYDGTLGNTIYAVADRGLVIGSGTRGSGTFRITGGTFSTVGSTTSDVVGNSANTGTLIIDGGNYITGATLGMGIGASTSVVTVNAGTATVPTLNFNNTTGTLSLNGGTLALNGFSFTAGLNTIRFNGGTLQARVGTTNFMPNVGLNGTGTSNLTANVQSLGAVIDTNNVSITIAEPLLEDAASPGGGITKKSAGVLTLGAPSSTTGPAVVEAGGLGVSAGAVSWSPLSFTHSGDTLNFNLGVYNPANPVVIATGALTLDGPVTVNLSGSQFQVGQVPLISYSSQPGSGSLAINPATLPVGVIATVVDNGSGLIYLDVTQAATVFNWSGDLAADGTGTWDKVASNWNGNSAVYSDVGGALANFSDIAGGGTVTVGEDVAPLALSIQNTGGYLGNVYSFVGAGKITGTTSVTKGGAGIAVFNGAAHSFSGTVSINAGALVKRAADDTTGNLTVSNNATLALAGGVVDGAGQSITLSGPGATGGSYFFLDSAVQRGALQAQEGANTWAGNVILTSTTNTRIGVQNGASLTIGGTISESTAGVSPLFRAGALGDDIILNGSGTWTGNTQVFSNGGALVLGADNRLPVTSVLSLNPGTGANTVFDLGGHDQTVAGLIGGQGIVTNNGATPSTLTSAPPLDVTSGFFGSIVDGLGTVAFVKDGAGLQQFTSVNSYSGGTVVNAGRLEIIQSQTASGDIVINGGSLKLSSFASLANGVNLSIASGGFFYPDGTSQTLGKLEGAGTIDSTYNAGGIDTLSVGAGDVSSQFDGVIQQSTVRTYALNKIGTGTFTLTGLNSYTGNTVVEDGVLSVAQPNFADSSTLTIGSFEDSPAVLNLPNVGTDVVASLIIDGVEMPAGTYDASNSGGAITGSGQIEVPAVGGFATWIANPAFGLALADQGPTDDPDLDGVENLLEYVLNGNPAASDLPILPVLDASGLNCIFSFERRSESADDTVQVFEYNSDLGAVWTEIAIPATSGGSVTITPDSPVEGVDQVQVIVPKGANTRLFGRLKVTQ